MSSFGGLVVEPFVGVGEVRFGSLRDQVRFDRGLPESSFRRSAWEPELSDHYERDGLIVSYALGDRVAAVEMTAVAKPAVGGIAVLEHPAREVLSRIRALGLSVVADDPGTVTVPEWGVSLFSEENLASGSGSFRSATANAYPVPEAPEFYGGPVPGEGPDVDIRPGGVGAVVLGDSRARIREVFGEGMATTYYGQGMDIFFAGVTVTYDDADRAIRLCVTQDGAGVNGVPVSVGMPLNDIRAVVDSQGIGYMPGPAEIRLPGGIRVCASSTHNPGLPASSITVAVDTERI